MCGGQFEQGVRKYAKHLQSEMSSLSLLAATQRTSHEPNVRITGLIFCTVNIYRIDTRANSFKYTCKRIILTNVNL